MQVFGPWFEFIYLQLEANQNEFRHNTSFFSRFGWQLLVYLEQTNSCPVCLTAMSFSMPKNNRGRENKGETTEEYHQHYIIVVYPYIFPFIEWLHFFAPVH